MEDIQLKPQEIRERASLLNMEHYAYRIPIIILIPHL